MKTNIEIEKRLRTLRHKYTKKVLAKYLSRVPSNCKYHGDVSYIEEASPVWDQLGRLTGDPTVPVYRKQGYGVCFFGMDKEPSGSMTNLCNDVETAVKCKFFSCKFSKAQILSAFNDKLFKDHKFKATFYKDLAALEWVLGDDFYEDYYKPFYIRWWIKLKDLFVDSTSAGSTNGANIQDESLERLENIERKEVERSDV